VLVVQYGERVSLVRLRPDGTASRIFVPNAQGWNGAVWADERGIVQLEGSADGSRWEVAAYALPGEAPAQPFAWPAADVVFATPEEAAADFVREVLGVAPALGEFRNGDAQSGEIDVFSPGEVSSVLRGVLLLRRLGEGWFVIGSANPNATIDVADSEMPPGSVTVSGVARGFETTVHVWAFRAGDADHRLDEVLTSGGAFETPEPYSVTIDLSEASPGDVITLVVHGDTGLDTDPGEFGVTSVVITD
jgi:hypothetical protein